MAVFLFILAQGKMGEMSLDLQRKIQKSLCIINIEPWKVYFGPTRHHQDGISLQDTSDKYTCLNTSKAQYNLIQNVGTLKRTPSASTSYFKSTITEIASTFENN